MKRIMALAAAVLLLANCHASDGFVSADKLPKAAKEFMYKHYPAAEIISVQSDNFMDDYEVILKDGTNIEFSYRGAMKDVEAPRGGTLPASVVGLLPQPAQSYLKTNYADKPVRGINKDDGRWQVELNGLKAEVVFDKKGGYLGLDD
ncbi:MAG: PepSY-like domain-containing protein [Rikenellaceae bacterium]|nr:PepSY-like domain-containing protein [Rikenellaceae bacterium]